MNLLDSFSNDTKALIYLQDLLIARSTGLEASDSEYKELRSFFIEKSYYNKLPEYIVSKRNLDSFWSFIKYEFSSYAERREFIYDSFVEILNYLEFSKNRPTFEENSKENIFVDADYIYDEIKKGHERKKDDPEGALTIAKSVLESTCKYILDKKSIKYSSSTDFSELYKITTKELNLSSDSHTNKLFKQILGNCSGVVSGINKVRNVHSDSHGKGLKYYKIKPRHSELAIELAGAMAAFMFQTYLENEEIKRKS